MRPRALLVFSSLLVLASACAKAASTGGDGGATSGPGGDSTTGNPTTGGTSTSTSTGSAPASTGSGGASANTGGGASTGSSPTSTGSTTTSTSSGAVCAEDPCKLTVPQCGCAAGEQCSVSGSSRACVPGGNTPNGQPCANAECSPGLLCASTGPGVTSTCNKFCDSDADCVAPGGLCLIGLNDPNQNPIPGVTLCTESCDPTTNIGCPAAATSCQVGSESGGQMRFFTRCLGAGAGKQGTTCASSADCAPKFGCFNTTNPMAVKCLKHCKASAPNGCPAGTQCVFSQPPELVGAEEYGACL